MNRSNVVLTSEAVEALERGQMIEAIKIVRQSTGLGLKESKDAVDAYLAGRPDLTERIRGQSAEGGRRVLVALAMLAAVGLLLLLLVRGR